MLRFASWLALAALVACPVAAAAPTELQAVPRVPGAFAPRGGPAPIIVNGKPLEAGKVEPLAGKTDGYDLAADGESIFGMEYAHRVGRREPLRAMAADLSDWEKAPACPPDRLLVDPASGRVRFFAGHDPASFHSRVLARYRGTHGDNATPIWRGDTLFLSHWESSFNLWAYDVSKSDRPQKVGEIPVANFVHGFVLLESGYALVGSTSAGGLFLVDLRDPAAMRVVRDRLVPHPGPTGVDWIAPVTPRYVAVWGGAISNRTCRVFDTAGLKYHGRVAALAQAAREAGLEF